MKFGSLFSGIGGFDLGLERAGWTCAWQCEVDPFASAVLAHHWPEVPNLGDVRNVGLRRAKCNFEGEPLGTQACQPDDARIAHVDLVCGGFPCQDLSVAGKRRGLAGERSGLWFEFHRVLSDLRPTYCLIENVPGLLSSNGGRDFGVVLDGLAQLWPAVGWAILDSQHFGVPQRRRRVFVIAGPSRERVAQILSLCEGGDWHPQTRREAGARVAFGSEEGLAHSLSRVGGVRRLTPTECERLQGFPDGWTRLDDKTADGPRYRALGNAVTVPVIEYIGRRILAVAQIAPASAQASRLSVTTSDGAPVRD